MDHDDVRYPDEIINEQLIEDVRDDFEKQIDDAIKISIQDITLHQIKNQEYEQQVIGEYKQIFNERQSLFSDLMQVLIKLSKYDNQIKNIYEIIEPIIESYCSQYINVCELDVDTYNKIFNTLKTIRCDSSAIDKLKTIIVESK